MSAAQIHPTAIVDLRAELGAGTIVGPYCVIGADVVLGPNCWLQHHVTLCGPMQAGAQNKFYAYSSIGQQTQDLKYQGEPTYLEIGDENTLRSIAAQPAKGRRASAAEEIFSLTATLDTIAELATMLSFPITERSRAM